MTAQSEDMPSITIGITCYAAEDTIARAIHSALAQDYPHTEILVAEDASPDSSREVVTELATRYPQIRMIVHEQNQGPAGARQTILRAAKGLYIAFFDDDDEAAPERIRTQYERSRAYEEDTGHILTACYASGERLYLNGYRKPLPAIGSTAHAPTLAGEMVADRLLFYGPIGTCFFGCGAPSCALMARTETFRVAGGFDPAFRRVEDIDFAVRLAMMGGHFIGCPEFLFTQYATQAMDKSPEKNLAAEQQLADKHATYLRRKGMYRYAKDRPLLRYYHFKKAYMAFVWVLVRLILCYPIKTLTHLLDTGPKRLLHESKMRRDGNAKEKRR